MFPHDPLIVGGWMFYLYHIGRAKIIRFAVDNKVKLPFFYTHYEYRIKHIESGTEFRFSAIDALRRWKEELDPQMSISTLSSYSSPFLPCRFDSAYVGKVFIEGLESLPDWEDINLERLPEVVARSTRNELISSCPTILFYRAGRRERLGRIDPKSKDQLLPLFNLLVPLCRDTKLDDYFCYFHLVVTEFSWNVSLCQQLLRHNGTKRIREMNMQCYFGENIVFREIIESQSTFFEEGLSKVWQSYKDFEKNHWDQDDETRLHFHEAKQFNIQACGVQRCNNSFALRKLKKSFMGTVDISDENIGLLIANRCEKIKSIEAKTGTSIQIVPLFRHPYLPNVQVMPGKKPDKVPRRMYIDGAENNIEKARSRLRKLLRNRQLCSMDIEFESSSESSHEIELETDTEFEIDSEGESESEWESEAEGAPEAEGWQFAREKRRMHACYLCRVQMESPRMPSHLVGHIERQMEAFQVSPRPCDVCEDWLEFAHTLSHTLEHVEHQLRGNQSSRVVSS